MDKEQLKEAVGELNVVDTVFEVDGVSYIDTAVSVMQVYDLIDQLDEPEKVVVPQWFDEWAKGNIFHSDYRGKMLMIKNISQVGWSHTFETGMSGEVYKPDSVGNLSIYHDEVYNDQEKYIRAVLDGYEVEKEKLYRVIIPTKDTAWKYYYLDHDGGINMENNLKYVDSHTEEFIRSISDDLWHFAEEVAE